MGIIYKVTHLEDETVYVGQSSKSLEERKISHKRYVINILEKYSKGNLEDYNENTFPFQYYFEGEGMFEWEIIDTANTQEELNIKEDYWINYYKNLTDGNIYNLIKGGHYSHPTPMYYDGSISETSFLNNNSVIVPAGFTETQFKNERREKIIQTYTPRKTI